MDMLASLIGQLRRKEQIGLELLVLAEMFYFFTVVVMWLIHAGFMMYEAGAARRNNIMSTAIKNIPTIAVVTPTFYYFGWYIYGCFQPAAPPRGTPVPRSFPVSAERPPRGPPGRAEPADHISLVFFLAFLLFSWTTGSIMSGALIERVRLSAYLLLTVLLGSAVWIMDAAWGWSSGGWLVTNYGFHDSIASRSCTAWRALHARRPSPLARASPNTTSGRPRYFKPHNTHMTLSGQMLIFTDSTALRRLSWS